MHKFVVLIAVLAIAQCTFADVIHILPTPVDPIVSQYFEESGDGNFKLQVGSNRMSLDL
jgi:hypothetical protein